MPHDGGNNDTRILTRRRAIPLAIGSVAGSGILFLPSAVYAETGSSSPLVWALSVMLCVPMLLMFEDMVRNNPDGEGIETLVGQGLGEASARCVPVMFVALVIVGLPAGAIIAGRYLMQATGIGAAQAVGAVGVLAVALLINAFGVRASSRLQSVGAWSLVAMSVVLVIFALSSANRGYAVLIPDGSGLGETLPTVVLAFWAFAGFENLTFLSREFQHPARDFLPVSAIALGVYGVLTILLTFAIAVQVPQAEVDSLAGLLQLAQRIQPAALTVAVVTLIALGAMMLNAVSWTWGVSRLIAHAARRGVFPSWLGNTASGVPQRALVLLGILFAAVLAILMRAPGLVTDALATASAVFIILYVMCIVAYLRVRGLTLRSLLNLLLLVVMVVSLWESGWRSLYGVAVALLALSVPTLGGRLKSRLGG